MSQLHQSAIPSAGDFQQFTKLTWEDFVQQVIELTIQAYQLMYHDGLAMRDWEENAFTLNLAHNYLHPLTFDRELPIRIWVRTKTHTKQMLTGKQATIEAKEIDLLLHDIWEREYHTVHFVWEAKRVGDKRVNADYSGLNSEYVNEAIYRFIRREYAADVVDAGVLAYVLAGNVANIVTDINQSMGNIRKNPTLDASNHLLPVSSVENFPNSYQSQHVRINNNSIRLHHLFLTFDFVEMRP
ncbi:MAG: hypothetical protein GY796_27830 [Chloroflexi bacterium]|nr:hypothetical protein [Chloroflexota bacterium]